VLVLARPYHADPGINHRLGEELQALGYPVLTVRSLPLDPTTADLGDLAPDCANSGSAERLWGARFAARHGGMGVVDLSSFKCGQDAPTYAPIREILDRAGIVTCRLHDLDETRPVTSLRVRLLTFAAALRAERA
jgi:predicted nucleotide-binding protein (sugar kinase/HSP70/actin superfamily)